MLQGGGASYVETYHGNLGILFACRGGMETIPWYKMAKNGQLPPARTRFFNIPWYSFYRQKSSHFLNLGGSPPKSPRIGTVRAVDERPRTSDDGDCLAPDLGRRQLPRPRSSDDGSLTSSNDDRLAPHPGRQCTPHPGRRTRRRRRTSGEASCRGISLKGTH